MIATLTGTVTEKTATYCVIEAHGVGYCINISLQTYSKIKENCIESLYTHLQILEDAHKLWGFYDQSEREIFRLLISCNGIGCNTARMVLSSMEVAELKQTILNDDVAKLKKIKGIGDKTAALIVLELKPKFLKQGLVAEKMELKDAAAQVSNQDAISALCTLGFTKKESETRVLSAIKAIGNQPTDVIIKQALKV